MKFGCPELSEKMFNFLGPIKPSRPWSKEVVCDNEGNITVATDGGKFLTKMQLRVRQKFQHYVFVHE